MPPEMMSAPHTSARISRKYLRKSCPRCTRLGASTARRCSTMGSTSFSACPRCGSLYHLVRRVQHGRRNRNAQGFRALRIDYEFELHRLLNGQLRRVCPLEDAVDVERRAAVMVDAVGPERDQSALFDKLAVAVHYGQPKLLRPAL